MTLQSNISITLADIIGQAILSTQTGTISSRLLDAQLVNPKGFKVLVKNEKALLSTGSMEKAVELAKQLIKEG